MKSIIERTRCPFCKNEGNLLPHLPKHLYCSHCQLAWVRRFVIPTYDEKYYQGTSPVASKLLKPLSMFFYFIRSLYVGLERKKLWIDVGAGDGSFLQTVRADKKIGVEFSASARLIMQKSGIETLTDIEFLKKKGLQADVISFWHVLEHVPNPWDYIATVKRNLIPKNGRLIIGVPNIDCLEYHIFGSHWFHTPKFHIWENTPGSIALLVKQYGFNVNSIDYWSPEHHLPCLFQTFINASTGSQGALHRFIRRGHDATFRPKDAFWSVFWLTIGAPAVILFWIIGSLTRKSGTIVITATYDKKKS